MKILYRYIGQTVIGYMLLVVLIFIGIEMFIEFINELQDLGKGNYGVLQAFVYVPLSLPHDVYQLFPVAGLIGCLMGLGRLASNSELIVMRASGISKAQITYAVVLATAFMLVIMTLIGEVAAPISKEYAQNYKTRVESGAQHSATRRGVWVHDGDNFIHIDTILPNGHLQGILRYKFAGRELQLTSHALGGYSKQGQWIFTQVNESQIKGNQVITQHYDQQNWQVSFDPNLIRVSQLDTDQTSLVGLYHYITALKDSGLSANRYEFAFWKRVLQPLATLVMICLAIPFIFGPLRTVSMGLRILIGVIVGVTFFTLNEFFGPFSMVYQVPPLWAASMPIILFALIDIVLMYRVR